MSNDDTYVRDFNFKNVKTLKKLQNEYKTSKNSYGT